MSFLRPEILPWLGALLFIPLLYLIRRRAQRAVVPHLFLWEKVLNREGRTRRNRIRDIVGILLQMLIGAALIVAWAGPYREKELASERLTWFHLDVSSDMARRDAEGRSALELARIAILEDLPWALGEGPVGLALAGEGSRTLLPPTRDPEAFRAALGAMATVMPAGPRGRLDRDALARRVAPGPKEDGVRHRLYSVGASGETAPPGLRWVPVLGARPNAALVGVEIETLEAQDNRTSEAEASETFAPGARERLRLRARVRAFGEPIRGRVVLRGASLVAPVVEEILSPEGSELEVGLEFEIDPEKGRAANEEGGWLELVWESADGVPDGRAADDRVAVRLAPPSRLRLGVVGKEVPPPFLEALIVLDDLIDLRRAGRLDPASWRKVAADYDLIALFGLDEKRPLPPGNYLIVDSEIPGLGLKFERAEPEAAVVRQAPGGLVLRGLDLRNLRLKKVARVSVTPAGREAGLKTLIEATTGVLLSAGDREGLRFVHFAGGFAEERSSFSLLPAFPLFLADAITYLGRDRRRLLPAVLATASVLDLRNRGLSGNEAPRLRRLDGREGEVELRRVDRGIWRLPELPGRYELELGARRDAFGLGAFDIESADTTRVWPAPAPVVDSPRPAPVVQRQDWAWLALALAALLLLFEWMSYQNGWTS
jgi:aerotolerance regulator-like protein